MAILPVQLVKHRLRQYDNIFFGKAKLFTLQVKVALLTSNPRNRWIGFTIRFIKREVMTAKI